MALSMFLGAGGFGEFSPVANADVNLVALPEAISFVQGAALGCRFMTAFHGVTAQGQVKPGEWVAVWGCGGVGLAAVDVASAMGANVIGISRTQAKLDKAMELGAVATVQAGEDAVGQILEMTGGGAHVSLECLGTAATWLPSFQSLRTRGRLVRLGMSGQEENGILPLPADVLTARELEVRGSMGMQARCYPEMLRMIEAGVIKPQSLVSEQVPLSEASRVLESMSRYDTVGYSVIVAD